MPRPGRRFWLRARRLTAGIVLVVYVIVGLGIPVPQAAAKNSEPRTVPSACCSGAGRCCCSDKAPGGARPCCEATQARGGKGCCEKSPTYTNPKNERGPRFAPLKCPCSATMWVMTGSVLPAIPTATWQPRMLPCGWLTHFDMVGLSRPFIPLDPPPRV